MVVGQGYVVGIVPFPSEYYSPLVVDSYGTVAFQFPKQDFQSITWGDAQVL